MFFYGVVKSHSGRTGGDVVSVHLTRDAAVRMVNLCQDGDDMAEPQRNYDYSIKNIPVNIEKLNELGIISLEG